MQMTGKNNRILDLYDRLMNGETISKQEYADRYGVNEKSVQRDLRDIRNFFAMKLAEEGYGQVLIYDRKEQGYRLETQGTKILSNSEILAVCKILLDSRSLTKSEMERILNKLICGCVPQKNMKFVKELISNEIFHYIEPNHHKVFLNKMWDLGMAIHESCLVEVTYTRRDGKKVTRTLEPLAIMFSEYYFYLTAYMLHEDHKQFAVCDDPFPTIYRIDRIESLKITKEHFHIPYKDRFEEGEFRKRIQFMVGGRLRRIKFYYKGKPTEVEAILDRLPTAHIVREDEKGILLTAEVFGDGVDMWIRSQGDMIEMVDDGTEHLKLKEKNDDRKKVQNYI